MESNQNNINKLKIAALPVTLEGAQLAIQNADRLFKDSQTVSIPTKVALLEIGLEEVAKGWAIILSYEIKRLDGDQNFEKAFLEVAHIDKKKIKNTVEEMSEKLESFNSKNEPNWFAMPFDVNTFKRHDAKITFLSTFIYYIREIQFPIIRKSSDRIKAIREIYGGYISTSRIADFKDFDQAIDGILDINVEQLNLIIDSKEYGLYLDIENNTIISPSVRRFETTTLESLLSLLIAMAQSELTLLFIVLSKLSTKRGNEPSNRRRKK